MYKIILIALIFSFSCDKIPNQINQIEYRENLSGSEFKEAIIGKWESVYKMQGKENVEYLELTRQGIAKIIIEKDGITIWYFGSYYVDFLRPPTDYMVTFAELTIKTSKGNIILSRVNFGLHNGVPFDELLLRIDKEPYGVLKKR